MREAELVDEPLQRARLLERVQVLALYVLDEGDGDCRLVRDVFYDRGHGVQARHLRGPPTPLAGNDLVARLGVRTVGGQRPHDYRLDDALGADRLGKLGERLLAHVDARLKTTA